MIYGAILLPFIFFVVPPLKPGKWSGKFDYVGALLFAPAVAAILFGITEARSHGWASMMTGGMAAIGLVVAIFWFMYEWRIKDPLIDVRLLKRREVWVGNLCGAIASAGMMQLPVITLLFLQQPTASGTGL